MLNKKLVTLYELKPGGVPEPVVTMQEHDCETIKEKLQKEKPDYKYFIKGKTSEK